MQGVRTGVLLGVWAALSPLSARAEIKPPPDARSHWAFHPPREVAPPRVRNTRWPQTDLDQFILARLEGAGLSPAPTTDPRTLIRRMSIDLTGLPPTVADVESFSAAMAKDRPKAIQTLIDRLLASPRYGERWGRHWLDVARYSDTKGYVYAREERRFVHAPTYRDWVIRAFNDDLPYDRFLLLQIAADQLTTPESPDRAAMGFLTGGRRFIGVTHDIIDDRIDVITRGTMGLTVACARCHDHKYDPIPTQDYYSLYGVFHGCDDRLVPLGQVDDAELAKRQQKLADMMARRRGEANARLRARVGDYLAAQFELERFPEEGFDQILTPDDLIPASVRRWRDYLHTARDSAHPIFGPWYAMSDLPEAGFAQSAASAWMRLRTNANLNSLIAAVLATAPASRQELAHRYGQAFARAQSSTNTPGAAELLAFASSPLSPTVVPDTGIINNEIFFPTSVTEELWKISGDVDRRLIEIGAPAALILTDRDPEPDPRVFKRGSPSRLGESVPRRFLEAVAGNDRKPFVHGSGRLDLARAIAAPENPLTARVIVNRIWQHHFGSGLVKTPSDFGLRAERPSHPELLDWLARRLVADGWSLKSLHRLILSSAVYQQSSSPAGTASMPTGRASELDPDNRLLSHFPSRRLEFEALRDAMLAASGELELTMGGKPVELLDAGNHRRTVYALVDRQFLPGTFRTFDFANPDIHVAARHETTVPQQALFFLNGSFAAERARVLTRQTANLAPVERVQRLYGALYQRAATTGEIATALQFVADAGAEAGPAPALVRPTQWRYGTGDYEEAAHRLKSFTPLAHFTGSAWQGASAFPGGATGWAQLTAEGGHPGNTRGQACVRRWVAPHDGTVSVSGILKHEPEQGDGVSGFIVSSRQGELRAAQVHQAKVDMAVNGVELKAGDTLDFIVHIGATLSYDQFLWAPVIQDGSTTWDARAEFSGPEPAPALLSPWEQYAQVLLLANEFAFAD